MQEGELALSGNLLEAPVDPAIDDNGILQVLSIADALVDACKGEGPIGVRLEAAFAP